MAIFKKVAKAGKYQDDYAIHNLITYITRPDKTPSQMIGGYGIDPDHIADSMVQISNAFNKNLRIRLHHFIVSFCKWECSAPGVLYCIGNAICNQIGPEYQIAFRTALDQNDAYENEIFSTRKLEEACKYRVDFMWLLENGKAPDHSTLSRFRTGRCAEAVEDLFYQYVKHLEKQGEVDHKTVFIDGTKLESRAGRYSFVWRGNAEKGLEKAKAAALEQTGCKELPELEALLAEKAKGFDTSFY